LGLSYSCCGRIFKGYECPDVDYVEIGFRFLDAKGFKGAFAFSADNS
jgi:hypothetical protein